MLSHQHHPHSVVENTVLSVIFLRPFVFPAWKERGVASLGNHFSGGLFMIFDLNYNIPHCCHFKYVQLEEAIKVKMISNFDNDTAS